MMFQKILSASSMTPTGLSNGSMCHSTIVEKLWKDRNNNYYVTVSHSAVDLHTRKVSGCTVAYNSNSSGDKEGIIVTTGEPNRDAFLLGKIEQQDNA